MSAISLEGLDRAAVLVALFNNARIADPLEDPSPMTIEEARTLLGIDSFIGELRGRVLNVSLSRRERSLKFWRYDLANGLGAARRVIESLRR